jgi:predicted membrane protein DUF2306
VQTVERRSFWIAVAALCAIAAAASIRRLIVLADPGTGGAAPLAALDAAFAAKAALTRGHVIAGLAFALALPLQFSARLRGRRPRVHRWVGRLLVALGLGLGVSAFPLVAAPVGGRVETTAIIVYAAAFVATLLVAWWHIRHHDVAHHREWMLRATGIVLGIATTRPVIGVFVATSRWTQLQPSQFFGPAFWIGFTSTVLVAEWYIRSTRGTKHGVARGRDEAESAETNY